MHALMTAITDAGDLMVTTPLALALLLLLWRAGARPQAWRLAVAWTACFGVLGVLKLVFTTCGEHWHAGLHSPSGHAGLSTLVYGSYALVLAALPGWRRPLPLGLAGGALIAAIGISRIVLHEHTPLEVLVGLLVGFNCLLLFASLPLTPVQAERVPVAALMALLVLVPAVLQGSRSQAEDLVVDSARRLHFTLGICQGPPPAPERLSATALPIP